MNPALENLLRRPPVVFEGAMGTQLMQRGLQPGRPGEDCTIEHPEWVEDIHRGYAGAGVRVHKTNSFNANRLRLKQAGLTLGVVQYNRAAVELARNCAAAGALVAGSIGPTGELFDPAGALTHHDAVAAFAEQAAALAEAGVDFLLVETMYDVRESLAALEGCRSACDRPVIVTMTFMETPFGFRTLMGDAAEEVLPLLERRGADAVGANCTLDSAGMIRLARLIRPLVSAPLLIQPNAGQPQTTGERVTYPETPEVFAKRAAELAGLGVEMIGGCCGTTPAHIAAVQDRFRQR